jgi:hypothetical protein
MWCVHTIGGRVKSNTHNFFKWGRLHKLELEPKKCHFDQSNQILYQLSLFLIWCCSYSLLHHLQSGKSHKSQLCIQSWHTFVSGATKQGITHVITQQNTPETLALRLVIKGKIKYATTLKWHLLVLHKLDGPEFMDLEWKSHISKQTNQIF